MADVLIAAAAEEDYTAALLGTPNVANERHAGSERI